MESTLADFLGLNREVFHWIVVPVLIFCARVCDVSINTVRVMFVIGGRRNIAPLIGFVEAMIWLVAIQQIMQNLDSISSYIAYAAGFSTGIYVGMKIEEKLAYGKVVVRVITQKDAVLLIEGIKEAGYGLTIMNAEGSRGSVNIILTVLKRDQLKDYISIIHKFNPKAFYTIENVRYASESVYSAYADIKESRVFSDTEQK